MFQNAKPYDKPERLPSLVFLSTSADPLPNLPVILAEGWIASLLSQ